MRPLTPLGAWRDVPVRRVLDPAALGDLVVVAAHPDDETLAVSGVMQAVLAAGGRVELVVATDGDAAFPDLDADGRAALARTRCAELAEALRAQGLGSVRTHLLGLPDSALDADELTPLLVPLLADADSVLAPWTGDPHPDHVAAGVAAARAAPVHTQVWGYPVWMWAWCDPQDPPWHLAHRHPLDAAALAAKRAGVAAYASQHRPGPGGEDPILPPLVLEYFDIDAELVFRAPRSAGAPVERFDALYGTADGDPWDTRTSAYERRKRDVLLACLPREHYRAVAEPACGTGELTRLLAARGDRLHATDASAAAVAATRAAVAGLAGVTVAQAVLPVPETLPDGTDLAVLSEVLYYLGDADLAATIDRVADAVVPGGDVVLAHWRGWPAEAPRDAADTHEVVLGDDRFDVLVAHTDEGFLLHVLRRR